jgi:UDP-N-acetylmuramate dehydrogenase
MNAGGRFGDVGAAISSLDIMDSSGEVHQRNKDEIVFGYRRTNLDAQFILQANFDLEADDPQRVLRQAKQMWIYKKNSQPLANRSAGCVFRNPRGLSAGSLIDQVALKGKQIGGAMISPIHANFIVVDSSAKASDVQELIALMQQKVQEKFEVQLELELEIW